MFEASGKKATITRYATLIKIEDGANKTVFFSLAAASESALLTYLVKPLTSILFCSKRPA